MRELRLLDVLDGDQADASAGVVDDQQLLDAVLVQQPLGLVLVDALLHRDQVFWVISSRTFCSRVAGRSARRGW